MSAIRSAVLLALLALAAAAQTPPAEAPPAATPRTRVSGRVVDAQTGAPLKGAHIIVGNPGQVRTVTAEGDFEGSFSVTDAPSGDQQISVRKSGYSGSWNRVRAPAGRGAEDVRLEMNRMPAIAGRVLDAGGAPVPDAQLRLLQSSYDLGRPIFATIHMVRSDDRGMFRIWRILPGDYVIKAVAPEMPGPDDATVFSATGLYYPNAPTITDATRVHLDWGQTLEEINLQLGPQAATRVDGLISFREAGGNCDSCDGELRRQEGGIWVEAGNVGIRHNAFAIVGLPTGSYVIRVEASDRGNGTSSFGVEEFVVTEDRRSQVVVDMRGPQAVSGRVVLIDPPQSITAADAEPWHSRLQLMASEFDPFSPMQSGLETAEVSGTGIEGAFELKAVPGRYRLGLYGVPGDGYIRGVAVAGRPITGPQIEVSRSGLEDVVITVAYDAGKVSGKVDMGKTAVPEAGLLPPPLLVRFVDESNQARYVERLFTGTNPDGTFEIGRLPPGRYRAFAMQMEENLRPFETEDPTLARKMAPWSKTVEVRPGQTTSLDLKQAPPVAEVE